MTQENTDKTPLTLASLRARLHSGKERQFYWRSLNELAESPEFEEFLHREFPRGASEWSDGLNRRKFLKLMGASFALAGLTGTGCINQPTEKIVPYVEMPEDIVPGKPLFFATAMTWGGYGLGLLGESHMGRPIKVEGNPSHPATLGATNAFAQASVLSLYAPDRSETVQNLGQISTWEQFVAQVRPVFERLAERQGEGIRILTETVTSPTLAAQIRSMLEALPGARWHQFDPVTRDSVREGARRAFGQVVETTYRFDRANVVVSLDCDFLFDLPGSIAYGSQFAQRRRPYDLDAPTLPLDEDGAPWIKPVKPYLPEGADLMNRLYVVESTPSLAGAMADHRLPMRPSRIETLARALARALGVEGTANTEDEALTPFERRWVELVARDLLSEPNRGASIVLAGYSQPPAVHALVHAINDRLGNIIAPESDTGTVAYLEPVEAEPIDQLNSLRDLTLALRAGEVELLLILDGNPVFTSPADVNFAEALREAHKDRPELVSVHLSDWYDETSLLTRWHIPLAHYLESWSDVRAFDGTATIIQPLIAPIFAGRTAHEVLAALFGEPGRTGYQVIQEYWEQFWQQGDQEVPFKVFWETALHDGVVPGTQARVLQPQLQFNDQPSELRPSREEGFEIVFRPDPSIWDGRFANNGWLQELPKPHTKLTWGNAALVSPKTAAERKLKNTQVIRLEYEGEKLDAPVWVLPGQPDGVITVSLGYGHTTLGEITGGVGYNAYRIRNSENPWFGTGLKITKTDRRRELFTTQDHHLLEGRDIVRFGTLDEFKEEPHVLQDTSDLIRLPLPIVESRATPSEDVYANNGERAPESLYPEYQYDFSKYPPLSRWGMSIDQNSCIGCNACVIACQAENNIPIVGPEGVSMGREMHWLRIDRYYWSDVGEAGDDASHALDNPETLWQPMLCQHCEKAPCELVCPVAATVHSTEGLNDMIYNRCVGTRYCSNNCPYKVRRFNFLQYTNVDSPVLKALRNPDVTIRTRGVMEKCTYCVQRINEARIEAKKADPPRPVGDGDVVTACQQACPTQAIVFGNMNDRTSKVSLSKRLPLTYGVLADINTYPRTTYLGKLINPNPALLELEEAEFGRRMPEMHRSRAVHGIEHPKHTGNPQADHAASPAEQH